MKPVRVDFITNQAPHYRAALWKRLLEDGDLDAHFLHGEGATSSIRPINFTAPPWRERKSHFLVLKNIYFLKVLIWQRGVLDRARKTNADALVLLGQMYVLSTWLATRIARRRGISILFWGHGVYGRERKVKRWLRYRFLRQADGLLVYGNHARRRLVADGFEPNRITTVYNSLNHRRQVAIRNSVIDPGFMAAQGWFHDAAAPTLLFVGRLTPQKQLNKLIEAVGQLRDRGSVFNLVIVGEGPEMERLRALASTLNGQVFFYGACYDEDELGSIIANSNLCVSPGEIGLTAMHSLGFGTPVCTHNDMDRQCPEAEAVIDGITGSLFDYEKMDIAEAIERWFRVAPDREIIRCRCYQEIDRHWNTENSAQCISRALRQIVFKAQYQPRRKVSNR